MKQTEEGYSRVSGHHQQKVSVRPMVFLARYIKLFTSVLAKRLSNSIT